MNPSSQLVCTALAITGLTMGCDYDRGSERLQEGELGSLGLPLSTHGSSGAEYRLRNAELEISGYPYDCYWDGTCEYYDEIFDSEDYLDESSIILSLTEGDYTIYLHPGWQLERLNEEGEGEIVDAVLLSDSTQWVWVSRHATSWATFQFGVGDEDIWLNGQLNIDIEVYEDPDEYYGGVGDYSVGEGGYVTSGQWKGYAWTALGDVEGSTINPEDFSDAGPGDQLCIHGNVAASPEWAGFAMMGLNLNQEEDEPTRGVWQTDGSGIAYDIFNGAGSGLRLQIQGVEGYPDQAWCAPILDGSGFIPWNEFNTQCWDYSGEAYDPAIPLEFAAILVPGESMYDVNYDFCIGSIGAI